MSSPVLVSVRQTYPPPYRAGALAFGSAIHSALAVFYSRIQNNDPEPTSEELKAAFADAWRREMDVAVPVLLDKDETSDGLLDKGVALVAMFHKETERPHRVLGVEEPFSVELINPDTGEVTPERLVGVFDVVVEDEGGRPRILETKTAARRWSESKLAHDIQITAYVVASSLVGLSHASVTLQLLLKTQKPAIETYQLTRTDQDRADFVHTVVGVLRAIQAEAFYPAGRNGWACAPSAKMA